MAKQVFLIYDNTSPNFNYTDFEPKDVVQGALFRGAGALGSPLYNRTGLTSTDSDPTDPNNPFRYYRFHFQGTSVAFFGHSRHIEGREREVRSGEGVAAWNIDSVLPNTYVTVPAGGSFAAASEDPLYYTRASGQWFTSPTLADDFHHIYFEFNDFAPVELLLDFAVVEGGTLDKYDETTNIVVDDDTVQEIYYYGNWERNTLGPGDGQTSENALTNYPYRNGTRRTRNVGSGFRFRFLGTSIRIYSARNNGRVGSYEATFTIDSEPPRVATHTVSAGSQSPSIESEDTHALLIQYTWLDPVEHILTANLTKLVGDQVFIFDYLVYTPAFPNLHSKPVWQVSELDPALGLLPNRTLGSETPGKGTSHPVNVGALAGGLAGGLCGLLVCALAIFIIIRKRRQKSTHYPADGAFRANGANSYISPFDGTSQASESTTPHWVGDDIKRPGVHSKSPITFTDITQFSKSASALGQNSSSPSHNTANPIYSKSSADPAFTQQERYPNSGSPPTYLQSAP
ncbi:hypothetical protein FA15DRAFT_705673 [Coprinopsis marcescibilis]|uniref:Uncharacterized protein n=1 Tax=Coprinopsis marcescibilis TaxID=230819 RepID=A0A5C3KRZ2_COPMA|nr:hypothetical protein FA15DRAFT_705673 [Coprinopsis marcescibilis]